MQSINPFNQKVIKEYSQHTKEEIDNLIKKSHSSYLSWKNSSFSTRAEVLLKIKNKLLERKEELARLMALEMGKPITQGRAEIEKCAYCCDHFARSSEGLLQDQTLYEGEEQHTFLRFRPLGVILAVMPWNFPFWQVIRFLAPNLMAGNTCILKHASNVTGCALAIESIIHESCSELTLLNTAIAPGNEVESLIAHELIAGVTLTGSTAAGQSVSRAASKHLKKVVLELGGSDPYIVFEDADLDLACEMITQGRMLNSGQSCIAAKRFLLHKKIKDELTKKLIASFKELKLADPLEITTQLGPMAKRSLRDELHQQVQASIQQGAKVLLGASIPDAKTNFYPPTLLDEVKEGMPAYHEELFGPVGSIIEFENDEQALSIANATRFGLGSAIFTKNKKRIEKFCSEIDAGNVFVNEFVKSDPRFPFGGVKMSGHGRELGDWGIYEFVNIKTISVNKNKQCK